jgi:hypothetical protein
MRGARASPNYVATAVVLVRVAVSVRVIVTSISILIPISIRVTGGVVVIRVAESEEAVVPEVVITESTAMKSAVAAKFTATEFAGHPAAAESAQAATVEGASHAAMETAASKAAAVETAAAEATAVAAAKAAAVATATSTSTSTSTAATRQCHCWRSQANRRNCQQRDNRLTQHHHSPSETLAPNHSTRCTWRSFWKIAIGFDDCITQLSESDADQLKFRERGVRLNSKSEIKLCARRRPNGLLQMKLELEFSQQKSCGSNRKSNPDLCSDAGFRSIFLLLTARKS